MHKVNIWNDSKSESKVLSVIILGTVYSSTYAKLKITHTSFLQINFHTASKAVFVKLDNKKTIAYLYIMHRFFSKPVF